MKQYPPPNDRELAKVSVNDITLGMYMAYADRPWLETPFLFQGFLLDSEPLLQRVRQECEFIYVDEGLSMRGQPDRKLTATAQTAHELAAGETKPRPLTETAPDRASLQNADPRRYATSKPVEDIFKSAYGKHSVTLAAIKDVLKSVRRGEGIDVTNVRRCVNACVASIVENPNAMLWLSKLRHRDEYTAEHCLNVGILAIAVGRHLGLERSALETLGLCGMLHDVGKMQVDNSILNKACRLTADEFDLIKTHCLKGKAILERERGVPPEAVEAAWGHHERMDGDGYPHNVKAASLNLCTRIISIVDTYDAITTNRCYDNSRPATEAIRILFSGRDTQFDGWLVEEFIACLGIYPTGSLVELHSGEGAVVIDSNKTSRLHPKVSIVLDENKRLRQPLVVDTRAYFGRRGDRTIRRVLDENDYDIDLENVFSHFRG